MSESEHSRFPTFADERGTLIAAELGDVPFEVTRLFVVRGPEGGASRGGHFVDGTEHIVLLRGTVTLTLGENADQAIELTEPGSRVHLEVGTYLSYVLHSADSEILVLCDRPFAARSGA
jgi:hypothetical protein